MIDLSPFTKMKVEYAKKPISALLFASTKKKYKDSLNLLSMRKMKDPNQEDPNTGHTVLTNLILQGSFTMARTVIHRGFALNHIN